MSVHIRCISFITFVVILCDLASAQLYSAKFDFNRTSRPDFIRDCQGKYHPNFVMEPYGTGKFNIAPYRQNAKYFLTNNFYGIICAESFLPIPLSISPSATIEMAIYLKSVGNAFVEINVYDNDRNLRIDSLRNDGTAGWFLLKKKIPYDIPNARIEIYASMNNQSVLGIEYINLLSSDKECNVPVWCWVLIVLCLIVTIAAIISATAYCILEKRRARSHRCANK